MFYVAARFCFANAYGDKVRSCRLVHFFDSTALMPLWVGSQVVIVVVIDLVQMFSLP